MNKIIIKLKDPAKDIELDINQLSDFQINGKKLEYSESLLHEIKSNIKSDEFIYIRYGFSRLIIKTSEIISIQYISEN